MTGEPFSEEEPVDPELGDLIMLANEDDQCSADSHACADDDLTNMHCHAILATGRRHKKAIPGVSGGCGKR